MPYSDPIPSCQRDLLSILAAKGPKHEVKILLDNGADVNKQDSNGRTPLSHAAEYRRFRTAQLLIERGADVDVPDFSGRAPISFAAESDDRDLVELLLNNGADINSKCEDDLTPLHYAGLAGNPDMVEMLLERGADKDIRDCGGGTALISAAEHSAAKHVEEVVSLLKNEFFKSDRVWRIYPRVTRLENMVFDEDWNLNKGWDWLYDTTQKGPLTGYIFFQTWDKEYTVEDLMEGRRGDKGPWAIKFPTHFDPKYRSKFIS